MARHVNGEEGTVNRSRPNMRLRHGEGYKLSGSSTVGRVYEDPYPSTKKSCREGALLYFARRDGEEGSLEVTGVSLRPGPGTL